MIFDASSVPLIVRPAPIIKVETLVSVAIKRTDLAKMRAFLLDFGFKEQAAEVGGRRFLRGYGTQPYSQAEGESYVVSTSSRRHR
jgi:hypothetical protein